MTAEPLDEEVTRTFEHPIQFFPEEHYLAVRELARVAEEEHPPCQSSPDLWWPERGHQSDLAVRMCKTRCTMQEQCLRFALEVGEDEGIWGGATPAERRSMRRQTTTDTAEEPTDDRRTA
ncbi:WhiB family transcription factor [Arthrobacter phage Ottawa]|nr:WhiB family transcription factor [Arthrobacter phage Kharcho]WIC89292.1 WhiB family transcription factor [Arthrobacter phage Ottawa]